MTRREGNFNPPTVEDLQETRRANEKLVLAALESKPEWVETELAKTTGLALSHLRAALASLLDQGRVRRLPGTGTRAVYGMADPGLADVPATPLTDDAKEIKAYLRGRADSALHMSEELRLSRDDIMAAVSLLNAHGMITCTFVGNLVIFRLKEESVEAEAEGGKEDKKEASKTKAKSSKAKESKAKTPEEDTAAKPKKAPKAKAPAKATKASKNAEEGPEAAESPSAAKAGTKAKASSKASAAKTATKTATKASTPKASAKAKSKASDTKAEKPAKATTEKAEANSSATDSAKAKPAVRRRKKAEASEAE